MLPQLRTNSSETGKAGPELRVVAIGGGTGLSTLLKGLKRYVMSPAAATSGQPTIRELCGVVTVSDDGGSSGRLRKEFNMLPPGDVRNCIVALSEDEALLSRLFQHRFQKGSGLEGHSFGNLFLAALTSITGDFAEAVRLSSEILLTRGHIYPATMASVELEALMEDGTRVRGETRITASKGKIRELALVPPDVRTASPDAGGNRWRRPDHDRPGIALHQPDSELTGARNSRGDSRIKRHQSIRLQLNDAGE